MSKSAENIQQYTSQSIELVEKWKNIYMDYLRQHNTSGKTEEQLYEDFSICSESLMDYYYASSVGTHVISFEEFLTGHMSYYEKFNDYYKRFGDKIAPFVNPTKSRYLP